jgi:hypothetical protein
MRFYQVGAGVEANVTGQWITNIRKVSPTRMQVSYVKGNTKTVAIKAGSIGTKAAKDWYWQNKETLAFEIDLAKPDGWALYRRMLKGDIGTVKKYYLKELAVNHWIKYAKAKKLTSRDSMARLAFIKWKTKALRGYTLSARDLDLINAFFRTMTVKMITVGTRQAKGTSVKATVGLPFVIRYSWVTGDRSVVEEKSRELADGVIGTSYIGLYKESKSTAGLASHHANTVRLFMGGIQEIITLNPGGKPDRMLRIFAQFKYEYHRTDWDKAKWDEKVRQTAAYIGHRDQLVSIPRPYPDRAKFGQQTADYLLSENSVLFLMHEAHEHQFEDLIQRGRSKVEEWFGNENHQRTELCTLLVRPLCKKYLLQETEKEIPKALKALSEMQEILPHGNEAPKEYKNKIKKFAGLMAEFGQHLTSNQFVLNAFAERIVAGPGDSYLVFQWKGVPFPRGRKVLIPSKLYQASGQTLCGRKEDALERCVPPNDMTPM